MSTKKNSAASAAKEPKCTKKALLNSKRFRDEQDIVSALLKDDVEYTISEVEDMIKNYMKGKVK
jgi:arginine repressor